VSRNNPERDDYGTPLRRLLLGILCVGLVLLLLVWRIDSVRVERLRAQVVDQLVPRMDWVMAPMTGLINLGQNFQSYQRMAEQNRELRRELRQMRAWKEAALQLEQENARLLDLNNVRLDPQLTYITGVVLADSGSPFRQSVLLNIGERDGVRNGWAAMDGIGLVGRISGTGGSTSRVVLATDANSSIPALIQPSGQTVLVDGDNSAAPAIDFLEKPELVRPGDRVVTSGDGDVFPSGLLIGQVVVDRSGQLRVHLSADFERLEFLRVLRNHGTARISDPGDIVGAAHPTAPPQSAGDTPPETDAGE
jgi:rod shape-determining protein MreC